MAGLIGSVLVAAGAVLHWSVRPAGEGGSVGIGLMALGAAWLLAGLLWPRPVTRGRSDQE